MCLSLYLSVPCCPDDVSISVVSTDTLEIMWTSSRGAELYETRAADSSEVILCNDTAPMCALSDLSCDSSYSVVVMPCNEISGCNRKCKAHTKDTGIKYLSKYPNSVIEQCSQLNFQNSTYSKICLQRAMKSLFSYVSPYLFL